MRRIGLLNAMPGDFLRVMGKVLLFSSVGIVAASVLGGAGLALGSILGAAASATAGVACLMGSAAVQQRVFETCYGQPSGPGAKRSDPNRCLSPEASSRAEDAAVSLFCEEMAVEDTKTPGKYVDLVERQAGWVSSGRH